MVAGGELPVPKPFPKPGHTPLTPFIELQGNCLPGAASSSINRVSDHCIPELDVVSKRLVSEVFKNTWIFTCGMGCPNAVGIPPVQFRTKSPTSAVRSSDRAGVDTPPLRKHWNGVFCALAVPDEPSRKAITASTGIILRKSTISFSL